MGEQIKVAILEDHPIVVDGYTMNLRDLEDISIVQVAANGEELTSMLKEHPDIDVLIMDINVPMSADDKEGNIPILHLAPEILEKRPNINILVISMLKEPFLIKELMDAGVRGYLLKGDNEASRQLPSVIRRVTRGTICLSENAKDLLESVEESNPYGITYRQLEILSMCAAYPDSTSDQLANQLGIVGSTVRNLLQGVYTRLNVHTKAAAIARARELKLIP